MRRLTDPENAATTRTYDGLDRMVRQDRPEGIIEKWTYDESSRLVAYADAKDQTTTTAYDALNRPIEITWADSTKRRMAYDTASNVIEERDPNGNVITQAHDAANRLLTRSITKGINVVGPTSETYAWDGLNRLKTATSGTMTVDYEYDSLSRVLMEKQNGKEVRAQFDDASNRTQLVYPSGLAVGQRFDALDRPSVCFSSRGWGR
ncbi:MAG: RHS repeat protein [Nitrospira sp.]|nr:RHS repeat protein [Nitrospira sp.]